MLGEGHPALKEKRVATCQSLSGTGSLHTGFCILAKYLPDKKIFMPSVTWPNHYALYDKADTTLDDNARLALIAQMQERIREACPWIFLYHRKDNLLLLPHVRNVVLHDFPYGVEKHWRMIPQ